MFLQSADPAIPGERVSAFAVYLAIDGVLHRAVLRRHVRLGAFRARSRTTSAGSAALIRVGLGAWRATACSDRRVSASSGSRFESAELHRRSEVSRLPSGRGSPRAVASRSRAGRATTVLLNSVKSEPLPACRSRCDSALLRERNVRNLRQVHRGTLSGVCHMITWSPV